MLLEEFMPQHTVSRELLKIEIENLAIYGYGIKGYILSMIEAALKITNGNIPVEVIQKIIDYGKELLNEPIELLNDVEEVLREPLLSPYRDHV